MSISPDKLKMVIDTLRKDLGEGFVATDIWTTTDALSLVGSHDHNRYPKAVPLFNEVTRMLDKTLRGSEYPGLGNYYFVNLNNNQLVVVLSIDIYQQFILVDLSKTTMGILMSVVLPNLLNGLAETGITDGLSEVKAAATPAPAEAGTTETEPTESPAKTDASKQPRNTSPLREFLKGFTSSTYYADKE